jgi:hypothetical protein
MRSATLANRNRFDIVEVAALSEVNIVGLRALRRRASREANAVSWFAQIFNGTRFRNLRSEAS